MAAANVLSISASNVAASAASRRSSNLACMLIAAPVATGIALLAAVLLGGSPTGAALAWGAAAGLAGGLGLLLAYHSLTVGLVGVVVAVTTCVATVTQLLLGWLVEGRPAATVLVGGLICLAAVVLTTTDQGLEQSRVTAGTGAAAGAGVLFALFVVLISRAADAPLWALGAARLIVFLVALAAAAAMATQPSPSASVVALSCAAGALDVMANLFLLAALTELTLGVLAAFQASGPVVAALLAWVLLKERLHRRQVTGMVLALLGVLLALRG